MRLPKLLSCAQISITALHSTLHRDVHQPELVANDRDQEQLGALC